MEKKSGVDQTGRSLPRGGGANRAISETFQPNLAMGGGSYKVPFDLPQGPGGFSPKLDLLYNTGFGNGPFGLGWVLSVPFVEQKRTFPFAPAPAEPEYSLSGADTLVPLGGGQFVPFVQQAYQPFSFDGTQWTTVAPNLVTMRFGSSANSKVSATIDGNTRVHRWLLDRVTFPGGRQVTFEYEADGAQRYIRRIQWSVFRLEVEYEARPDPFSLFNEGFELRTTRRCRQIALHQDRLAPETLMRTYEFEYQPAERTGTSMLARFQIKGWRFENGALRETATPPLTFGYTGFTPEARRITKFQSNTIPPPSLGDDVTLLDYQGTSLPGVLRMNGMEATYWENRGRLTWGPPQRLPALPQGVHLSEDRVRFADLTGNGTADLVLAESGGAGYYPNDPEKGFLPKKSTPLAPSFNLGEAGSYLVDLDGDRVADLLTFRNGTPMAFLNHKGESWSGPLVLPTDNLPNLNQGLARLRFADMNGDGNVDMVMVYSRQIVYWPYLGHGQWGARRVMANTPEFDVPDPDEDVHLADIDGDGTADLVLVGNGFVRIYLNGAGESFSAPIELARTPRLGVEQFLLSDLTGSGTPGFLWTTEGAAAAPHEYWYLDLLAGVKPYLLNTITNGMGLATSIEYSTSSFERAADLAEGYRWSGYLPFVVHVIKQITNHDTVTGQQMTTAYRYHDGHYDGSAREYLGFAQVESRQLPTAHEGEIHQRFYFHNRSTTARDPAFLAGKGQPHRTELVDAATGEIRRIDESVWQAVGLPTLHADRPAFLALETVRTSRRIQGGAAYEAERMEYQHDLLGNVTREYRRGEWTDSGGNPRVDELITETAYASHPIHGLTSLQSRLRRTNGGGRLLKHFRYYYDGPAFTGLPLGQVENGFYSRQVEMALTAAEIAEAYGGIAPPLLNTLYDTEVDPEHGPVYTHATRRYRADAFGNQIETIDAMGHQVAVTYDPEAIHPVSISQDGGQQREMTYDPIAQQLARMEDLNGNIFETRYDGLGNPVAVYRRDAEAGRPTESYEYRYDVVPTVVIQRLRMAPDDLDPGWVKYEYRDGAGRACQVKTLTEDGRWAVGKQEILSPSGRVIRERDAYFTATPSFEVAKPPGVAEREMHYDLAGRVTEERLFSGVTTKYRFDGNQTRFYGPDISEALEIDPATAPTRTSRNDAWGQIVSIVESDANGSYEQRRVYDALGRLTRVIDSLSHTVLESSFDLWGNRIRTFSAEGGTTTFIYDASNHEVLRTDADGRAVYQGRDNQGRITEVRHGGPAGTVEETFTYDAGAGDNLNGRLARVVGTFGTAAYSYSVEGDPVQIQRTFTGNPTTYTIQFGYNQQRHITFVEYPDGTRVPYQYYPNGMLASIPGYIDSITYGPAGKREQIVYANGLETRKAYTAGDYLLQEILTQPVGGGPKYQHLVHHLDNVGQVTEIDDLSTVAGKIRNNQTFAYDERNRLVKATGRGAGGDYAFNYQYDAFGNLVFSGESFAEEMEYGHHTGDLLHPNRLVKRKAAAGPEYTYDASGNMTFDPAVGTMTYDARHRLTRVVKPDGTVIDYRYDHNDKRTESKVTKPAGTTLRYEVESVYLVEAANSTKIIVDDDRRLAIVPDAGDPLLHHLDRLGNVNVVSNLTTGAFVGHDEYTPYGRMSVSILITPHFSFQGANFSDELDIALLGARYYRPALGRFLTPDLYLTINQEKIIALHCAANLYLYALANPMNVTDPTGQIAFLVVLAIAAIVGAVLGAIGAAANGASTWSEWLLWIIGGAIGGVLTALLGAGIALIAGASAVAGAIVALVIWGAASLLGSILCPVLDDTDSSVAWFFSFLLKWVQSPIMTTLGLIVAGFAAIGGSRVDLRRGTLFVEMGSGSGALTLGAIAWTQSDRFDASGRVDDALARHESTHSRTVVAIGEWGFYITYLTVGVLWSLAETGNIGKWNDLNSAGCGNPFEKRAHSFTDPSTPACN